MRGEALVLGWYFVVSEMVFYWNGHNDGTRLDLLTGKSEIQEPLQSSFDSLRSLRVEMPAMRGDTTERTYLRKHWVDWRGSLCRRIRR